jgi:hypothetical protein
VLRKRGKTAEIHEIAVRVALGVFCDGVPDEQTLTLLEKG